MPKTQIDHIGIAVQDVGTVIQLFEKILGATPYKTEIVQSQGVRTHFIDAGTAKLELLEATTPDSPIARYLENHKEGIHHLAFEVTNIKTTWRKLEKLGIQYDVISFPLYPEEIAPKPRKVRPTEKKLKKLQKH